MLSEDDKKWIENTLSSGLWQLFFLILILFFIFK